MQFTNLSDESDHYRRARHDLQLAEIELMRQRERLTPDGRGEFFASLNYAP
jgi:predicted dithiol-disulfide oxidoreductase (DUF899 family)